MNEWVNPSGEGSEGEQPQDTGRNVYSAYQRDPWGSPKKKSARDKARTSAKLLVGLLLVGVIAFGFWPRHHTPAALDATPAGTAEPWTVAASASVTVDASPSASASPSPSFTNPDDQYFVDSPALNWADNEAGFVLPKAAAVNGVSRTYIAEGYQELEKLMEAGNLDATILNGGSVTDFTKLIDPSDDTAKTLKSWLAKPGYDHDPVSLVTRFNPATTRLVGHTVKVYGSMSAAKGHDDHTALLTADYVFVYIVSPVSDTSDTERVIVHRTLQIEAVNPNYYNYVAGKAWVYDFTASQADIVCYRYDGYVDPAFGTSAQPNETGTVDPYATGNQLTTAPTPSSSSTQGECQAVSGT
ncbi:MAG TPA: hypothetical protein VL551_23295 [Actinospica sp.]|jgi:hypothetical protein|nr:hypothetical protein [Actinospica sp.]